MTDEYDVELFDAQRRPQGLLEMCGDLLIVERCNAIGSGTVQAISNTENWSRLGPGAEVRVRKNGQVIQAGRVTPFGQADGMQPVIKVSWVDHLSYLDGEHAWADPTVPSGRSAASPFDRRTGFTTTVINGFVDANIGPSALPERRTPGFLIAPDPAAGAYLGAPVEARDTPLLELTQSLAIVGGVQISVRTVAGQHYFTTRPVEDRSWVRFDTVSGAVQGGEWSWAAPAATRVRALGAGEGPDRLVLDVFTDESLRQEAIWGRRVYLHDSSTADPDALWAEAERLLAQKLQTVSANYTSDGSVFTPGVDYQLGDIVTVPLSGIGLDVQRPVIELRTTVGLDGAVAVQAKAGDYELAAGPPIRDRDRRAAETARVLEALKRSK